MIKIAAVGVAAVLMAMQLREMKPEYGMYLIFGTGLLIFFYAAKKLSFLAETLEELRILPQAQWERIVAFANAAGSLTTAAKGAIPAMPAREQILRLCGE